MKKLLGVFAFVAILAASVFAQNGEEGINEEEYISENSHLKKHQFLDQYFGVNIGAQLPVTVIGSLCLA